MVDSGKGPNRRGIKNLDPLEYQQSLVKSRIKKLKEDLPHLYGWGWYPWAKKVFDSKNKITLLCAANQIGKSSAAIRKNIEWACNKKLWPDLWDTEPKQFWYFYPTGEVCSTEVSKKWIPEFLPRGEMKNHEWYGWDIEHRGGEVAAIHFRSGVSIVFKSYAQKVSALQTSTIHMITADEEMREDFVDELLARLRRVGGYFLSVFTATQGLQLWYRAMECIGTQDEAFKMAHKETVSMWDCMYYDDGSPSIWSKEKIEEAMSQCTSQTEVLRRIYGRFVKEEGRKFGSFDPDKNVVPAVPVPSDWKMYAGVDVGSGGRGRSAGAVILLFVDPTFTKGRITKTWRGDHEETTAKDILEKYRMLRGKDQVTLACYDYQSREFGLIASRSGEPFIKADKARSSGEQVLNTLFQAKALSIDAGETDNQKLITELMSVPSGEKSKRFQDDLVDALRYAAAMVPWDFNKISPGSYLSTVVDDDLDNPAEGWTPDQFRAWEIRQRRGELSSKSTDPWAELQNECEYWNEAYGN